MILFGAAFTAASIHFARGAEVRPAEFVPVYEDGPRCDLVPFPGGFAYLNGAQIVRISSEPGGPETETVVPIGPDEVPRSILAAGPDDVLVMTSRDRVFCLRTGTVDAVFWRRTTLRGAARRIAEISGAGSGWGTLFARGGAMNDLYQEDFNAHPLGSRSKEARDFVRQFDMQWDHINVGFSRPLKDGRDELFIFRSDRPQRASDRYDHHMKNVRIDVFHLAPDGAAEKVAAVEFPWKFLGPRMFAYSQSANLIAVWPGLSQSGPFIYDLSHGPDALASDGYAFAQAAWDDFVEAGLDGRTLIVSTKFNVAAFDLRMSETDNLAFYTPVWQFAAPGREYYVRTVHDKKCILLWELGVRESVVEQRSWSEPEGDPQKSRSGGALPIADWSGTLITTKVQWVGNAGERGLYVLTADSANSKWRTLLVAVTMEGDDLHEVERWPLEEGVDDIEWRADADGVEWYGHCGGSRRLYRFGWPREGSRQKEYLENANEKPPEGWHRLYETGGSWLDGDLKAPTESFVVE